MIEFSNEDKENFIKAIDELIKQVDDCIDRNKKTKNGSISSKGTTRKTIENNLQFLKEKYNYSFKEQIGNPGGTLSEDAWIIFVRKELLNKKYINSEKFTAKKGIYIFIGYSGYFNNKKHLKMYFDFPDNNVNKSRCIAVDKIEREGYLQRFNFTYNLDDKDKLVKDFSEMMNYFNSLDENDFRLYETNKIQKEQLKTNVENSNIKEKDKKINENQNIPLNQILYGPPGTGKTYHTIDKALEILGENLESRDDKKAKFDEYVKNGQIVFTTFHQSYGYEEFVEGIRPEFDNEKDLKYKIEPGIFKKICDKASENKDSIENFKKYIEKLQEDTRQNANDPERYFHLLNTKYSIQYVDRDIFRIKFDDMSKNHSYYTVNINNIEKLYKNFNINKIYNLTYTRVILEYLKSQGLEDYKEKDEKTNLPYIIIIDEINRGNVSKIFGELITLIEPSKRIGNEEELRVVLPYSGEKFGVPKNVYIIGTMNTADRSITSLDTALRRRFEFVEMMPSSKELKNIEYKDVDLPKLLTAINTRIEYLLDREKTIGHAFFIDIKNLNDLKNVFQNKIIPLLQEYFYNDYALIDAVLNDNGMIFEDKKDDKYLQKIKNLHNVDSERNIYTITPFNDEIWDDIETYQAIYNDKIKNDKQ